jgi:hypothetical protein
MCQDRSDSEIEIASAYHTRVMDDIDIRLVSEHSVVFSSFFVFHPSLPKPVKLYSKFSAEQWGQTQSIYI